MKIIQHYKQDISWGDNNLQIITAIWIWFSVFTLLLFIVGYYFKAYNIYIVIILLSCIFLIGFQHILKVFHGLKKPLRNYKIWGSVWQIRLVIDEILFIAVTFLLSVNVLSVFRPFPIGWDDLGVYMNLPKLMSSAWEIMPLGHMHLWQVYTGIWFLGWSQTFAFFLNSFVGLVFAFVWYLAIKSIVPKSKNYYDVWLLGILIVLMMPMSIFQLAKDMKLDIGLLMISVIPFTLVIKGYFMSKDSQSIFPILAIVWFLTGIAFSIKMTSLLLLLGIYKLLFFKRFWLLGSFIFLLLFVWVFTIGGLWSMMNVLVPNISDFSLYAFSLSCILLAILCIIFITLGKWSTGQNLVLKLSWEVLIVTVFFLIALLPWWIKNISEIPEDSPLSITRILWGYSQSFKPNYESLYTPEEYMKIESAWNIVSWEGTTQDEDLWRYFGYETWINNYLKLPWNLTFQTNQKWEFTDITYVFFALIPLIFIFLPYRKEIYKYPILIVSLLLLLYYIPSPLSSPITQIFSLISLPFGYIFIALFFFLPFAYLYYTLDRSHERIKLFLAIYSFSTLYVFLWSISAFWIVWYGILMYFVFILMIFISMMSTDDGDDGHYYNVSYIVLWVVVSYLILSAIPQGVRNIQTAWYHEYKLWHQTEEGAIMKIHPDYFTILWELNINPEAREQIFIKQRNELLSIIDEYPELEQIRELVKNIPNLSGLHTIFRQISAGNNPNLTTKIENILQKLYSEIIYPSNENISNANIYRAGTFMKYFVSKNRSRMLEDNLLNSFDTYIYDSDNSVTRERLQKLDLRYILLDLNAATIDNDVRKALTQRYENMLKFTLDIDMIESDSMCLKLWRDLYKQNGDMWEYLTIAGSNYDSIGKNRQQKRSICVAKMVEILQSGVVNANNYPYLQIYLQLLNNASIALTDTAQVSQAVASRLPIWYKALFKVPQE